MKNKIAYGLACILSLCLATAWADDSVNYNQKTLPNGDVETTIISSDGSKVVTIQHKDGSVDSHMTSPPKSKE